MSSSQPPRLIIVTGVSGSGRASAMRVLEDLGFYCVDNLPVALAQSVAMLVAGRDPALKGVALGLDSRERLFFPQWPRIFAELDAGGIHPEVIFLDASDDVLARRYSETRRPHPMAASGATVAESIRAERLALAEMRERDRQIVDAVETEILEHPHRRRTSRSRHTGKYYEAGCLRRAHRDLGFDSAIPSRINTWRLLP